MALTVAAAKAPSGTNKLLAPKVSSSRNGTEERLGSNGVNSAREARHVLHSVSSREIEVIIDLAWLLLFGCALSMTVSTLLTVVVMPGAVVLGIRC